MDFENIDDFLDEVTNKIRSDKRNLCSAVDFILEFAEKKSFSPNTLLYLANAYKQQKMVMEEYVFAKACFIKASGKLREDACFELGVAAYILGFPLEAKASYMEVLKENPENGDIRCAYAELLLELGKTEDAEKEYKTVLEAFPEHVKANTGYAYLLTEYGYERDAEEYYSRALMVDPDYVPARGGYANLLFELGRLRDAEKEYRLAIKLDPEDPSLHHNCGVLLSYLERSSEAEIEYKKALSLNPRRKRTLFNYENLLAREGRVLEAEALYLEALALDQNDAEIYFNYANLLARIGRLHEAEIEYKKALSLDPESAEGHYSYGNLLSEIGRLSEAEDEYKKALVLNPRYPPFHYSYGLLMETMERFDEAEKEYMKGMQLDPYIGNKMERDILDLSIYGIEDFIYGATKAFDSEFSDIPYEWAWNDLHRRATDQSDNVRKEAAKTLGVEFSDIPDKQQAWDDLQRLITDQSSNVRKEAAKTLGIVFSQVQDKRQAWNDLMKLIIDKDVYVRSEATHSLGSAFFHSPYKQQAWNDLHKLTTNQDKYVRSRAASALGSAFSSIPDKQQASNCLHKLTLDEDSNVRFRTASALGSAYSDIPDKQQAWNDLIALTADKDNLVIAYANHSLGKISIFKASQAEKEEDYKRELENAIKFFEKASQESPYEWFNPAQFCLPLYRSFHTIIFKKQNAKEEVDKYLAKAKAAVKGSKRRELLSSVVENLANALKDIQNLENIDLEAKKRELNDYRKNCDRAVELMRDTEETAPYATIAMRKGLPILDRNLKELLEEIQKKAKTTCKDSKGTDAEEIACAVNREVQKWEIGSQEEMTLNVSKVVMVLKSKIPLTPENKEILDMIESIKYERDLTRQYSILPIIIGLIPTVNVVPIDPVKEGFENLQTGINRIDAKLEKITVSLKPGPRGEIIISKGLEIGGSGIQVVATIPLVNISYPELSEDLKKIKGKTVELPKLPERFVSKIKSYLYKKD